MGVAGAVRSVGVGAEGKGIEDGLDVVFLDGGQEGFVGRRVVGEGRGQGRDVGSIDVLGGDEFEALVARGLGCGFKSQGRVELGFPDHVADAVADLEEQLDGVGGEGVGVEGEGADFGNVGAEGAVDPAAFDAKDYAEVDRDPFGFYTGAAVGAPAVALVVVPDDLKEFGRVTLEAAAVAADVGWAGSYGGSSVYVIDGRTEGMRR